jgi:two-component system cell cycle response regulator
MSPRMCATITRTGTDQGIRTASEVAKVLNRSVRASDVVIRYGGDEFLGIVSQATCQEVSLLARRIQSEVDAIRLEFRPGEFARVGISVGMASFPEDGDSLEVLLQKADQAMYQNKHSRARAPENVRRILTLVQTAADQKAG